MVRKLGVRGTIPKSARRRKSERLRQRKARAGVDCFWTATDSSSFIDDNVLADI